MCPVALTTLHTLPATHQTPPWCLTTSVAAARQSCSRARGCRLFQPAGRHVRHVIPPAWDAWAQLRQGEVQQAGLDGCGRLFYQELHIAQSAAACCSNDIISPHCQAADLSYAGRRRPASQTHAHTSGPASSATMHIIDGVARSRLCSAQSAGPQRWVQHAGRPLRPCTCPCVKTHHWNLLLILLLVLLLVLVLHLVVLILQCLAHDPAERGR